MAGGVLSSGAFERAVARAAARRADAVERCGICSAPVPPDHRHLLDERDGGLACACRPCALLFDRTVSSGPGGTSQGHHRLVPTGRLQLAGLDAEALNVPVGLAFFVEQDDGRVLAHYPSPLGTTESEIDPGAWAAVRRQSEDLVRMRPRVEALLVRTNARPERNEHWVVPIDECYRLVALIRQSWSGMSGGGVVWRTIAAFFDDLGRRPGHHPVGIAAT